MNKMIFSIVLTGLMLSSGLVQAKPLKAKLIMPGGRSWKGHVVSRDGDWIEFATGSGAKPIRIGASTIQELEFSVKLDGDKLVEMKKNREYERIIGVLERALAPFSEYSDIPSNLSKYNAVLMELYFKIGKYDKSLVISNEIAGDDRDLELQEKARIYQALALIESGNTQMAEKLLSSYGWDQGLNDDSSTEKLYITAKLLVLKKEYNAAMELIAKVIAFHSQDTEWSQPAELLCAQVYTELGLFDSAEEVIREIALLYKNTNEDDQAQQLKIRIEKLRAEKELEQSLESEEA